MPFPEWVNKFQAKETSRDVPYHLLKQEAAYSDSIEILLIQGYLPLHRNCSAVQKKKS